MSMPSFRSVYERLAEGMPDRKFRNDRKKFRHWCPVRVKGTGGPATVSSRPPWRLWNALLTWRRQPRRNMPRYGLG